MANIPISSLPLVESVADSDFLAIDDGTTSSKITVQKFNETAAASAQAYAEAAATSAGLAEDYKDAAQTAKSETENLITSAQTIVSDAQTYANAAQTSENNASTYANNASNSASAAANSASQASTYAQGVNAYATEAKSWAQGGTGTRSGEDTDNAKYYSNLAHSYEQDASGYASAAYSSETNAASSESNASDSASAASSSASSASTDALKAEGYAVGKQNGVDVESGSPYYQANAKYYKEQAADSASTATTKASDASGYATAASGSASSASTSKEDSEAWAVGKRGGVDVPSTDPAYHNNAKYYADQAGAASIGVTSWNSRSGNVVPATHDYAANQIDYTNTTSGLTATDAQAAIDEVYGALGTLENGLGTAAAKDVPASGNASTTQVVMGDDTRLTDARTPVSHTHTKSEITDFPTLGTAAAKDSTNAVTQNSTDLVESGAVYTEVSLLNSALSNKINTSDIANNLTTSTAGKVLDATQGKALNENKVGWDDYSELGAVNLARYSNNAVTSSGVKYTVSDGVININRESTSSGNSYFNGSDYFTLKAGTYHFSNGYSSDNGWGYGYLVDRNSSNVAFDNVGGLDFTLSADTDVKYVIWVKPSGNPSNEKFYPMICLTSYNGDWQPPAKTNRELTDNVESLNATSTTSVTDKGITAKFIKIGNVKNIELYSGSLTEAVAADGVILTVPVGYRPSGHFSFITSNIPTSKSDRVLIVLQSDGRLQVSGNSLASGDALRGCATYI